MIINYKFMLLILFLLFLSISFVSATDMNDSFSKEDTLELSDITDKNDNSHDVLINKNYSDRSDTYLNNVSKDDLEVSDRDNPNNNVNNECTHFINKNKAIVNYNNENGEDYFENITLKHTHIEIISPENWAVYNEGEIYKIKLLDENNMPVCQSKVSFNIKSPNNNYLYYEYFTDYDGIASLPLNLDIKGSYNIQVFFWGNAEYSPADSVNSNVILYKKTIIQIPKKYAYRGSVFRVQLISIDNVHLSNQKVKVIIDKRSYTLITDANGFISVKMPSNKRLVDFTCFFYGKDYYFESNFYMRLPVYKKTLIKPLVYSILRGKYFKVLLKGVDGKILTKQKVVFIINKIYYTRTTNSKGIAYLKVNLKRKEYNVVFRFDNDGTYGPVTSSSVLNVISPAGQFKKGLNQNTKRSVKKYLSGRGYAKVTKSIKRLSKSITKKYSTKFEKVVGIYNYVRDHIGYSFYLNSKKGAYKTLKSKKGNCCDHASLIIALCRASKIPARYSHAKGCKFIISGMVIGHVWAQIYVGGRWYSADATSYKNSLGHIVNWNTKHYKNMHIYKNIPF